MTIVIMEWYIVARIGTASILSTNLYTLITFKHLHTYYPHFSHHITLITQWKTGIGMELACAALTLIQLRMCEVENIRHRRGGATYKSAIENRLKMTAYEHMGR